MRSCLLLALVAAWVPLGCGGQTQTNEPSMGSMLIVTTETLRDAAESYGLYRESTGFEVEIISTSDFKARHPSLTLPEALKTGVRDFAEQVPPDRELYVLLIADADENDPENPDLIPVTLGPKWEFGDTPYADLDADGVPDLNIGRIPYRDPAEVERYLSRVKEYESAASPGEWNKTVHVFAGEGGFGEQIDGILEIVAGWVFDELSYEFDLSMTYAEPSSDYFLPQDEWVKEYADRYQSGSVVMPYIGHTLGDIGCCLVDPPARRGLLTFFSCGDGSFQYTGSVGCLAEDLLLRGFGPVASLGATAVSHPYPNAVLPRELGYALLDLREPTYGSALRVAKYNLVHRIDDLRQNIDAMARQFTSESLEDLIISHNTMYNLLGDPALPTHLPPGRIRFDAPDGALPAGQTVTIQGRVWKDLNQAPMENGEIVVTLEVQRSVILGEIIPRDPTDLNPEVCRLNHGVANNKVAAQSSGAVWDGAFSIDLAVPTSLPDVEFYLKGYARNSELDAMGSKKVNIN